MFLLQDNNNDDGRATVEKFSLPPGSRLPRFIQTAAYVTRNVEWFRSLHERHGRIFTVHIYGFPPIVTVVDPELVKQVFQEDPKVLHAGTGSPLQQVMGDNSLLTIDEDRHLEQRRLLLPPLHGDRMREYESVIEQLTEAELDTWPVDSEFATMESFQRLTLRTILHAIFGATDRDFDRLEQLVPRSLELATRLMMLRPAQVDLGRFSPWGRFLRMRAEIDEICSRLVREARGDHRLEDRADMLALLAQARHADGSLMSEREILDQLLTMMLAGHETTASTLGWGIERVRRNPHALSRLTESVRSGESAYLDAVFDETLRVRPTVNFAARSVQQAPYEIAGYKLPLNTRIAVNPKLLHDDPELFDEPTEFRPERHLETRHSNSVYVPFGGGRRRCPGAAFARMEFAVAMRTILKRFDIVPTEDDAETWGFRGVTFAPGRGGMIRVRPA